MNHFSADPSTSIKFDEKPLAGDHTRPGIATEIECIRSHQVHNDSKWFILVTGAKQLGNCTVKPYQNSIPRTFTAHIMWAWDNVFYLPSGRFRWQITKCKGIWGSVKVHFSSNCLKVPKSSSTEFYELRSNWVGSLKPNRTLNKDSE